MSFSEEEEKEERGEQKNEMGSHGIFILSDLSVLHGRATLYTLAVQETGWKKER